MEKQQPYNLISAKDVDDVTLGWNYSEKGPWGAWELAPDGDYITFGPNGYWIKLEEFRGHVNRPELILGWVSHVSHKNWADKECVADLFYALMATTGQDLIHG